MRLSIIIPCYNEESTILKIVEKINNLNCYDKEIIVIDDFSTDKSLEILEKLLTENKIQKLLKNEIILILITSYKFLSTR